MAAAAIVLSLNRVSLEVLVDNPNAMRLYERLGYRCLSEPVTDSWNEQDKRENRPTAEASLWAAVKEVSGVKLRPLTHSSAGKTCPESQIDEGVTR